MLNEDKALGQIISYVAECTHVPLNQVQLYIFPTAAQPCTNGTVRLVGGPVESAGRVEVCIHGVWGRVCVAIANLYGFYGNYSRVVCRQLGYNVDAGEGELNHACIEKEDW